MEASEPEVEFMTMVGVSSLDQERACYRSGSKRCDDDRVSQDSRSSLTSSRLLKHRHVGGVVVW